MEVIGIVVEYNPFHNGHWYQIKKVQQLYPKATIIVVMSGYFTERGETSIINKWDKTKLALEHGVDLVVEIPTFFATQSADYFASAALYLLNELKITRLVFGSESNDLDKLNDLAAAQDSINFKVLLTKHLKQGINYPTALNLASSIDNDQPNDLLGVSYLKAINLINQNIIASPIKRINNYHDIVIKGSISSATSIRHNIKNNKLIKSAVPLSCYHILKHIDQEPDGFTYLKYKLISDNDLTAYLGVTEGINHRILKMLPHANSTKELISLIKTKRYTYNRIQRLLTHILLGIRNDCQYNYPDYIRILGFSKQGQRHLNRVKKEIALPIFYHYKPNISPLFDLDYRAANIYALILNQPALVSFEFSNGPIKRDE